MVKTMIVSQSFSLIINSLGSSTSLLTTTLPTELNRTQLHNEMEKDKKYCYFKGKKETIFRS
uniref:SFRICE_038439 n=1 Tax=Spodoptera frugiperda TaxID=7108 RepID=A0A2H1WZB8_SPOFR